MNRRRKPVDRIFNGIRNAAGEPSLGQQKRYRFETARRGRMQALPFAPRTPGRDGCSGNSPAPKRGKPARFPAAGDASDGGRHSPACRPAPTDDLRGATRNRLAIRREGVQSGIPELKVDLDRRRNFGIEEITAPLPAGLANHRGKVVHRQRFRAFDGLIAEFTRASRAFSVSAGGT